MTSVLVCIVNDSGEAMKKTQVIKDICNEFAAFAQIEASQDMSYDSKKPAMH